MTGPVTWSFTTTGLYTLWSSSVTPTVASAQRPESPVELGVKFTLRRRRLHHRHPLLQGPANTGTHVGNLWTASGTLLATATFTGETASGWQQVNFANPVAIAANTIYVASYHATAGRLRRRRQLLRHRRI